MFPYPERTTVTKDDGSIWTVSTIRDGAESIAFEEGAGDRQVYVEVFGHEAAVEAFKAATINADTPNHSHV